MMTISEAIAPKSRSSVGSLLSRPRLSSLRCCLHHATAPVFTDTPVYRSQERIAPDLHHHPHRSTNPSLLTSAMACLRLKSP